MRPMKGIRRTAMLAGLFRGAAGCGMASPPISNWTGTWGIAPTNQGWSLPFKTQQLRPSRPGDRFLLIAPVRLPHGS